MDQTNDPTLRSWVPGADTHRDFPIQNLPFGVFTPPGDTPRGGIAIGDHILDLRALHAAGLLEGDAQVACEAASGPILNPLLALGRGKRVALRQGVSALLAQGATVRADVLHAAADCRVLLPASIGDYSDFYAGIHHAVNGGRLFRPDNPLPPNYKYLPIGYHGRASSVRPSGDAVRRPNGQSRPDPEAEPTFGPARNMDYELELGIWVGPGNDLGAPVPIGKAGGHIAGFCLLNDWSARDIQAWEMQPLGPFLSKSVQTTISPWIVTPEALAPFRGAQSPRPQGDPAPLPHLLDGLDQAAGALDLALEVFLCTAAMREQGIPPHRLSHSNALNLYWTPAQMLAHHTSNGCNLRPGDLFGSGTISSATPDGFGSLLEITRGGQDEIHLDSGEQRRFLEDGDEVILHARAHRDGYVPIGFGPCRAMLLPAVTSA